MSAYDEEEGGPAESDEVLAAGQMHNKWRKLMQ